MAEGLGFLFETVRRGPRASRVDQAQSAASWKPCVNAARVRLTLRSRAAREAVNVEVSRVFDLARGRRPISALANSC